MAVDYLKVVGGFMEAWRRKPERKNVLNKKSGKHGTGEDSAKVNQKCLLL